MERSNTLIYGEDVEDTLFLLKKYHRDVGEISIQTNTTTDVNIIQIPEEIRDVFISSARDGKIKYPWKYLYTCVIALFNQIIATFDTSEDNSILITENELLESINSLLSTRFRLAPPFTVQRLCELLIEPRKYYNKKLKYLRAVDKVLTVISYAKVHYISPERSIGMFSPPSKKLRHETKTNSTEIIDALDQNTSLYGDSTNEYDKTISIKIDPHTNNDRVEEAESLSECSVSEADSTTTNGQRPPDELTDDSKEDSPEESVSALDSEKSISADTVQTPAKAASEETEASIGTTAVPPFKS